VSVQTTGRRRPFILLSDSVAAWGLGVTEAQQVVNTVQYRARPWEAPAGAVAEQITATTRRSA